MASLHGRNCCFHRSSSSILQSQVGVVHGRNSCFCISSSSILQSQVAYVHGRICLQAKGEEGQGHGWATRWPNVFFNAELRHHSSFAPLSDFGQTCAMQCHTNGLQLRCVLCSAVDRSVWCVRARWSAGRTLECTSHMPVSIVPLLFSTPLASHVPFSGCNPGAPAGVLAPHGCRST